MPDKYYSLEIKEKSASVYIFGDITSYPWMEADVSAYMLSKQINGLDADEIHVHINSYGGEVAEGFAIYNELVSHKAKIYTYSEGFTCSIASTIFMAGDVRVARKASLLMVHYPWTSARGNAKDFRKTANDLDKMAQVSIDIYKDKTGLDEETIKELLDGETWISADEALELNFATSIENQPEAKYSQSVRMDIVQKMLEKKAGRQQEKPEAAEEQQEPESKPEEQETKNKMKLFRAMARKEGKNEK